MSAEGMGNAPPVVPLRNAVVWTLLSLALFFAAEAAIFRAGWYERLLRPDSTAGEAEFHYEWLARRLPGRRPEILAMGDSRMAEGLSAPLAGAATLNRMRFRNAGMAGTAPRVWYYFLRDADPTRSRFRAVVLPIDRYWDQVSARPADINYAVGLLRLTDCPVFAWSFDSFPGKLQAFTGCVFKGITLRQDLKEFLSAPAARLKAAEDWRQNGESYVDGYLGRTENVAGIEADWARGSVTYPPRLNARQRETIYQSLMAVPAQEPASVLGYRELWLGRILDLYAGSPTRIVFIEMPETPLPRPSDAISSRYLETVRNRSHVTVITGDHFRDLERPELFADGLHLNREGRALFSERLGQAMANLADGR